VTLMTGIIGIIYGLVSGYFGGHIDNIMMRILDFFLILPFTMIVIAFVAIVPKYSVWTFSLIMTAFLWMGIARLVRSNALAEKELDYIQAARTLGTSNFKVVFKHLLPNVSSIIIVNMTI